MSIFKKVEDEDEFLEKIFDRYENNFNKNHNIFIAAYKDVKSKYTCILKNIEDKQEKSNFIKFERDRVENNITEIESSTNAIGISLFVLIVSIGITLLPNLFEDLNHQIKFSLNLIIIIGFTIIARWLFRRIYKYTRKLKIYDVAIKALNDIEKEQSKENLQSKGKSSNYKINNNFSISLFNKRN